MGGSVSVAAGLTAHHTLAASAKVLFLEPARIGATFEAASAAIIALEDTLAYYDVGALGQIKQNIDKARKEMYDAYERLWRDARDISESIETTRQWCCYGDSREECDNLAEKTRDRYARMFERIDRNQRKLPCMRIPSNAGANED